LNATFLLSATVFTAILRRTILHRTILRHTGSVCFCVMYMWFDIEGFP
jgi:uncharacterized MnhB-related membrane protein